MLFLPARAAQPGVDRGRLLRVVELARPRPASLVICSDLSKVSLLSGVLEPIVDPAPIVAPAPIRTGATIMVPEPMKAPSSMKVGHLLAPS